MRSIKTQSFILAVIFLCALIFACLPAVSVYAEGDTPEDPTPEPTSEPDPTPEPVPTPEPDPTPDPDPIPEPDPTPDPVPTPEPTPEPTPKPVDPLEIDCAYNFGWYSVYYDYSPRDGITMSSDCSVSVFFNRDKTDISYNIKVNGGSIPSDMSLEVQYGFIELEYDPKIVKLGNNTRKSVVFPKMVVDIDVTCKITGQTESKRLIINEKIGRSAYDQYKNRHNSVYSTSAFEDYMENHLDDSNVDNDNTNSGDTSAPPSNTPNNNDTPTGNGTTGENTSSGSNNNNTNPTPSSSPSPSPTQTVDTLASDEARGDFTTETDEQNNTVNVRLSFKDRFENNNKLKTVDVWYREKPNQTAFKISDLFVTTAYAANDDWEHIVLNKDNADISLTLDTQLEYDLICVANLADGKQEDIYYEIFPKAENMVVEANIDKLDLNTLPYKRDIDEEPLADDKKGDRSAPTGMSTPMLIIIISGILLIGSSTGIIVYTINEKKRTQPYYHTR